MTKAIDGAPSIIPITGCGVNELRMDCRNTTSLSLETVRPLTRHNNRTATLFSPHIGIEDGLARGLRSLALHLPLTSTLDFGYNLKS